VRFGDLAWRDLRARPLRTALTTLGIVLGVAVITASLIANQAASEAVRRAAGELFGTAQLRVRAFSTVGLTPRALSDIRQLPGVVHAAAVSERRLSVSTAPGPNEQVFSLLAIGVDPTDESAIRTYHLAAGRMPSASGDVLVNAGWAADHGLGIGDALILSGSRPGTPRLQISGLLDDVGFGALAHGAVAVMHRSLLSDAFELPAPISYVDVQAAAGQEGVVQRGLDQQLNEPFVVETPADTALQLGRAQASFAAIAFLFALIALVIGAFLVANTLAMTVSERTRGLGLLRAAGTTSRQVVGIFVREGLALGVGGSVLGILAGIGLAAAAIAFLRSTRTLLIDGLPLNPVALALAAVVGIVVTLGGAAAPAIQAARVAPLDALRPSRQPGRTLWARIRWLLLVELAVVGIGVLLYPFDRGGAPALVALLSLGVLVGSALGAAFVVEPLGQVIGRPFEWFFGAEGLLGRANLGRDRARTGLTVGALMIALAALVALGTVSQSARATADRWVDSILPGGYAIRLPTAQPIDSLRPTFEAASGTRVASPISQFPGVLRAGGSQRAVDLAGIDPVVFRDAGALLFVAGDRGAGLRALQSGGAVLVPEGLARRQRLGLGARIALATPGHPSQAFTVRGVIAYSLPGQSVDGAILMSLADARQQFSATDAAVWAMIRQPSVTESAFRASVADTARSLAAEPISARDLSADLSRSLDRLIGLFNVLSLVAVLVAAAGIVNALSLGVVERAREIAILRAHGMTTSQVQAMVVSEAAIMGMLSGLLAIGAGLLVAWVVVSAGLGGDGVLLAVSWPLLITVVLLGTGVAALAGIYPARLAARQPIVRSIMHFE